MAIKIAPSLMCADLLELRRDIAELERAQADMLHMDVMDGHFVPNLALARTSTLLDIASSRYFGALNQLERRGQ